MGIYQSIVAAMNTQFAKELGEKQVLDYEPNVIQKTPLMYTIFFRLERGERGNNTFTHYRMLHRLCVARQDESQSETLVMPLIDSLLQVIEDNSRLRLEDGSVDLLTSGEAKLPEARGGYARIGDAVYRVVDFYSDVLYKKATVRNPPS